jgi:GT2 family glycosyltransferase
MTTTQMPSSTRLDPRAVDERLPRVLAILVTHRGREWIRDCLVGLNTQTYPALDVLVVDDASPDHKEEPRLARIAKRHLRKRRWGYLRTSRPLGFGGAINWALSRVRTDADLLLFIHDDAALAPDAVEQMIRRLLADDQTAIVGPKIVSWDDPSRLEEVGMAIDRFGYPYKGLEEGEIDLGQHDSTTEVFYVTSTCMLVRHDVFRNLRGWDSRMKAFAEDLDLCWRARIAGHAVRTEPTAKVRHAIAMATAQRPSRFLPTRYYVRRNRLRALIKNVSALRLLALLPLFVLLSISEMLGFIVLRQPRDVWNLLRALGWNLITFPQTISERARVQHRRKVPDRKLRAFHVRETTRLRAYIGNQAERLEEAWGRRTEYLQERTRQARVVGSRFRGLTGVLAAIVALVILVGFRDFIWSAPVSVGELLPYPERASSLWRAWAAPWHSAGLGEPGQAAPGFALLGIAPILTLGSAAAAQKLLVFLLGGVAFLGAYKLVADLVDRPARMAAGVAYAIGGIGYAAIREGRLGALMFAAAAPFALRYMVRLTGWSRPAGWNRGMTVARLVLAAAVSAAFVPGSLFLYFIAAGVLAGGRFLIGPTGRTFRDLTSCFVSLFIAYLLLLPWSAGWWSEGGAMNVLFADRSRALFQAAYADHGVLSVVLGQTPDAPPLLGLALPVLGLVAAFVGLGQRRRLAIGLWGLVVVGGVVITLIAKGILPPFVPSATEASVIAALGFAGLVGLAVGAFRLDLPRRGLGWSHALTIAGLAAGLFLATAGAVPPLWGGEWAPGNGLDRLEAETRGEIGAVLAGEARTPARTGEVGAEEVGAPFGTYRALWVGDEWFGRAYGNLPVEDYMITGAQGPVLNDLFTRDAGPARDAFNAAYASIEEGLTDRGGALLGAFNIRLVLVRPDDADIENWLAQRDLGVIRRGADYVLLRNDAALRRFAVYEETPSILAALEERDPASAAGDVSDPAQVGEPLVDSRFRVEDVGGPSVAVLTETRHEDWSAEADEEGLDRAEGGWANAFAITESDNDVVTVSNSRSTGELIWRILMPLVWIAFIGLAFPRTSARKGGTRRTQT